MRDLLKDPLCGADDLGHPIPDDPHAVSVTLPTWESVIGYEEEDRAILDQLQCGYPRFFCHPRVEALFAKALAAHGDAATEDAMVYPSEKPAARCAAFLESRNAGVKVRVERFGDTSVHAVVFPKAVRGDARFYWRLCGEIVSSRQAESLLAGADRDAAGDLAKVAIRERLGALSGQPTENVFLFPTGMAAVFTVHRMFEDLFPGRKSAQIDFPYVDVLKVQDEIGGGAHFLPTADGNEAAWLQGIAATESLSGIFCEMPSNPLLRCVDAAGIRSVAGRHEIPIAIDDTVATVANIDAFRFADLVTTSLTKAFSGLGNVMGGSVIVSASSPFVETFANYLARETDAEDYFWGGDAMVLEAASRDFGGRVARMSTNAEALFDYLATHPAVEKCYFPKSETPELYEQVRRDGAGYGSLMSVLLKDSALQAPRAYDGLRISKGPSLGTNYTLACPYTLLAHYPELDWAAKCGVHRDLIRISVGTEDARELVERFEEVLGR